MLLEDDGGSAPLTPMLHAPDWTSSQIINIESTIRVGNDGIALCPNVA